MDKSALYQERLARIWSAVHMEPVDRLPVIYTGIAFAPRYMGMPLSRFCTDPEAAAEVTLAAIKRLGEVDGCNQIVGGMVHVGLSALWMSKLAIPGRELPENTLWQVQEAEVMKESEYDTIVEKGWTAFRASYLPRVLDMRELEKNMEWSRTSSAAVYQRVRDEGFVPFRGAGTTIPFEFLCGARSMQRFYLDLYRTPEKVKAAMDVMLPEIIRGAIDMSKASTAPGTWVGGWRSASALVAPKIWDKFVFPYFTEIVNALADNEITPILHLDQNWNRDLARLRELPAKKCVLNPDGMTDIRKAREILGDHMAIMGDVPASLFTTGTPEDIYAYVRDLVRDVGATGLLLCPGCDAPVDTKPENMEAFVAAGREFGKTKLAGA